MLTAMLAAGCASHTAPLARQQCLNPDGNLARMLHALEAERMNLCASVPSGCDTIPREIERQAVVCPAHTPTMMAAAMIAYEQRQPARAQEWLDALLALTPKDPEAAALRARVAIEQGNLPFALRFLQEQIVMTPSHPGLQEALGAALYLSGRLVDAELALTRAERLGAPHWRVIYDRALLAEARGDASEARRLYREVLDARPNWADADARLKGLGSDTP